MLKRLSQSPESAVQGISHSVSAQVLDFDRLLAATRRQLRLVALAGALGVVLAGFYVVTAVPQYTASAQILIDSLKDKNELSASIADLTYDTSAIDSQVEVLRSDKIALAVISKLNLTKDPEFTNDHSYLLTKVVRSIRSIFDLNRLVFNRDEAPSDEDKDVRQALNHLKANLSVGRLSRTYVLSVGYTAPDRRQAAKIANAVADAYLNEQLDARFESARRVADWLQTRLSELKQDSINSDLAIQKFKAEKGLVVTGGEKPGLISDQRLLDLNSQMVAAHTDTAKAEAQYDQIEDLLKSGRAGAAVPDSLSNPVINDLREKYLATSKTEAQLEGKLGPSHLQVVNLRREMQQFERLINDELERIAESYRSQAEVARAKEHSLSQSMSSLVGANAETNQNLVQLRELEREADSYRNLYQTFLQRYQEAVQQQTYKATEARVITVATPPPLPSHPKPALMMGMGLVLGMLGGVAVGGLREYRDRVFRVEAHVRDDLKLEFLGMLQVVSKTAISRGEIREPSEINPIDSLQCYSLDHQLSSFSETLRATKVALDLALAERQSKVVGVISALPSEGKSTVSKNLASLLAHLGAKTLLIDADLRNPGLSAALAKHATTGVLEVVRCERTLSDSLLVERESGLYLLPAVVKRRVNHSSEVLSSAGMRNILTESTSYFDYVVVDLPPLGPVVDVRAAEHLFDAFVLVVEWGRTSRLIIERMLTSDDAIYQKCVGVIYNKVDMKRVRLYENYGSKDLYHEKYHEYYGRDRLTS
jgi:succinoglycan biosynthesis transport protein ExoP